MIINLKNIKINLLTVIVIVTIVLIGSGIGFHIIGNKLKVANTEISDKEKTKKALNDSIKYYTNKYDEVVAEKLTLQGTIKDVTNKNNKLNSDQKDLMNRINEINKKNIVIAAANIKLMVKIDSLESNNSIYNAITNEITYTDSTKDISYNMVANNVIELKDKKSKLKLVKLYIPNTQNISFQWNKDKKSDYPVSFSVANTNKYFKVYDINSYIIPEVNKTVIKPNGWQQIGNFFSKTGGKVTVFGVGVGVGAVGIYLLAK